MFVYEDENMDKWDIVLTIAIFILGKMIWG